MSVSILGFTGESAVDLPASSTDTAQQVVPLSDGTYLLLWGGNFGYVYTRHYAADGSAMGAAVQIASANTIQGSATANGGYVLTWSGADVFAQRFDASGAPLGAATTVNTTTAGDQHGGTIATLMDGSFVIAWQSESVGGGYQDVMQRFAADGSRLGVETVIAGRPAGPSAFNPKVVGLANGGFVVLWQAQDSFGNRYKVFDAAGVQVGADHPFSANSAAITATPDGFAIGYSQSLTGGTNLYVAKFDNAGQPAGAPSLIQSNVALPNGVVAFADGSLMVSWSGSGLNTQHIGADGALLGAPFKVNATSTTSAYVTSAVLSNGSAVFLYGGVPGVSTGLYQARLHPESGDTLSSDVQMAVGDSADDVFHVPAGALQPGDQIDGQGGHDTILQTTPGELDFTGVTVKSIEAITGSSGDDTLIFAGGLPPGVAFDSGGGSDTLQLTDEADLSDVSLTGTWSVTAGPGQATVKLGSTAQVGLIKDGPGDLTIDATAISLSQAQRAQLFAAGASEIDTVAGAYVDADTILAAGRSSDVSVERVQSSVAATVLPGGEIVRVWTSSQFTGTQSVIVQQFDVDGHAIGPQTVLTDTLNLAYPYDPTPYLPSVVALADGSYVVAWSEGAIFTRQFAADGTPIGSTTQISAGSNNQGQTATTALDDGYVVVWAAPPTQGAPSDIHAQRFDNAGAPVGGETVVNTQTTGEQSQPTVTKLSDGGYVIGWVGGSNLNELHTQRFDANGAAVGGEVTVGASVQDIPAIVAVGGGYAIAWSVFTGQHFALSLKVFDQTGTEIAYVPEVAETGTYAAHPSGILLPNGDFVLGWEVGSTGIAIQRFSADGDQLGPRTGRTWENNGHDVSLVPTDAGFLLSFTEYGHVYQQTFALTENLTLTSGADTVTGGAGDTIVDFAPTDLSAGDVLTDSDGANTLVLNVAGTADLDAPTTIQGFQHLTGSVGDDVLLGSAARVSAFDRIDGGAGTDALTLSAPGTVTLHEVANVETFVGSAGDDRVILADGPQAGLAFVSGGGTDTLVMSGSVDLSTLDLAGAWHVTAQTGGAVSFKLTSTNQVGLVHGEDSNVTVDASTVVLSAAQRQQLFDQGVDHIIQPDAIFTPDGGLSRVHPSASLTSSNYGTYAGPSVLLGDGNLLLTWMVNTGDSAKGYDLQGQVFGVTGGALAPAYSLTPDTAGNQFGPAVAALHSGGAVTVWQAADADGYGIYAQRLDSSGALVGPAIAVNTGTSGDQNQPNVSGLAGGGFVVTWKADGATDQIRGQVFDASGTALGGEIAVGGPQSYESVPLVAGLSGGGFVITFGGHGAGSWGDVYTQRFDANGQALGALEIVNSDTTYEQTPMAIAATADGGYIEAWGDNGKLIAQRFDSNGDRVGGEQRIDTSTGIADAPIGASILMADDGGYTVAWTVNGGPAYFRRFEADGSPVGGALRLETGFTGASSQSNVHLTATGDGGFLATFDSYAVYAKAFNNLDFHSLTAGADTIAGQTDDLWVQAAQGTLTSADRLFGGSGVDTLEMFGPGTLDLTAPATFSDFERVVGSEGDDVFIVDQARIAGLTIDGGAGVNTLQLATAGTIGVSPSGLSHINRIVGSAGDDTFLLVGQSIPIDGGAGIDTASFTFASQGVTATAGSATLMHVENLVGSGLNDILAGDAGDNVLDGGAGFDTLTYAAATAGVTVNLGLTGPQNTIGAGVDTVLNFEKLIGSAFSDTLTGSAGADSIDGGLGADVMAGGDGNDVYVVENAGDTIVELANGGIDAVTVYLSTYVLPDNVEKMGFATTGTLATGNALDNEMHSANSGSTLRGLGGSDLLVGANSVDTLEGGDGDDVITGANGADTLTGGAGNDLFKDTRPGLNGDTITDFSAGDKIQITDVSLAAFSFTLNGSTLTYSGGSLTLANLPSGYHLEKSAAPQGVYLTLVKDPVHFVNNGLSGDFNGDGKDDLLWRSDAGQMSNWLGKANGGFQGNDGNAFVNVPTSWHVVAAGDFNGDGRDDIVWRSDSGQMSDWLGTASGGWAGNDANALTVVDTSWKIIGAGDFNGDGRDDILWRSNAGQLSNWLGQANGGFVGNDANAFASVSTNWHIVGVGDFNGDNRDDILWRSDAGQLSNWLGTASGGWAGNDANAFVNVPTDWHIVGVGDFNGDGRSDILWRSDSGLMSNWLGTASGGWAGNDANAMASIPTDWVIAGVGDYNGDGRDDIVWRHTSGAMSDWLGQANGGFAGNDANAYQIVDPSWHIQVHDLFAI